jgi:Bardet-Biedl syndrome 2 protein
MPFISFCSAFSNRVQTTWSSPAGTCFQVLGELEQKRRELNQESHLLMDSLRAEPKDTAAIHGMIPPDTVVQHRVEIDMNAMELQMVLETNNSCVIKGAIIFAEQVFEGESMFVHPERPSTKLVVPITPTTTNAVDMLIKVCL